MVTAVALHVVDEAITDFLPFYNDLVLNLRERLGFFPLPTFTFSIWISGLAIAVLIGYLLTPWIARGGATVRVLSTVLGVFMVANALGHMLGSIYFGRVLPGVWSSPLLLATAVWVVFRGAARDWSKVSDTGLGSA